VGEGARIAAGSTTPRKAAGGLSEHRFIQGVSS
jgi:hypothetical protein